MGIFITALENKQAGYHHNHGGGQHAQNYNHLAKYYQQPPKRRSRLKQHIENQGEYEFNHNLSDDEDAHNHIPGGSYGYDPNTGQYGYIQPEQASQTLNHKAHYAFEELFAELAMAK